MAGVAADPAHTARAGRTTGFRYAIAWMLREPFFQFVALGALLFAVSEYLEARSNFARIEITAAAVEGIKNNYRLQYGATPTAEQLHELVGQFVKEEVFFHEALRLKLDRDDEIVRRRLVQKYEFLRQDLETPLEPGDTELRAFYAAHAKTYEMPEQVTFTQVFFTVDGSSDDVAKARAQRTLTVLNQRGNTRGAEYGDSFPGAVEYADVSPTQVRRAFGSGQLSEEVFSAVPGRWSGPFRSEFGWHLVNVSAHAPVGIATYESVREAVRRDYIESVRGKRNAEALANLETHFKIVFE